MLYKLYYNFYETLKQFIKDENFLIKFSILNEKYILKFDKKVKLFVVTKNFTSYQKAENVYEIIRDYVIRKISNEQKETFYENFRKKTIKKIYLNEKEKIIFIELIGKFKKQLWEEPIFVNDINTDYITQKIRYSFADSFASEWFLAYLIETLKKYPNSFERGIIFNHMWEKNLVEDEMSMNEIEILETEGYIDVEKSTSSIKVTLTSKFYEALKTLFYYNFDPEIKRYDGSSLY